MLCTGSETIRTYKSYKSEYFNKAKQKAMNLLSNIKMTSLKPEDKEKLIYEERNKYSLGDTIK